MLQARPHAIHFKPILDFGEGQPASWLLDEDFHGCCETDNGLALHGDWLTARGNHITFPSRYYDFGLPVPQKQYVHDFGNVAR
jgi:hypothetical protein